MAGLGRIQQRFNAAIVTLLSLAGLRGMAGDTSAKNAAAHGHGHPLHAKFLRTQNVSKATGRDLLPYHGYCSGKEETARRLATKQARFGTHRGYDLGETL